jgi:hypothetical protein
MEALFFFERAEMVLSSRAATYPRIKDFSILAVYKI